VSTAIQIFEDPAESAHSDADQLGAEITELCSYIYAAESRLPDLIREFDEKQYWAGLGLCSCAHWLNFKCGIGMNAAREKVRVAHALAGLPKISEGFASGKLSYSKVRAITRIADESNEDYLLMIAENGTAHHVEKLVSKYRTAKRLQDAEIANEEYDKREVTYFYDHDGSLVIKGRLPPEPREKSVDGEINFKDQREIPLESSPEMPGVAANDDVQQWMDREVFETNIDSASCAAKWQAGERMDWHAAVGSLFN
jgi:hypothetical protein